MSWIPNAKCIPCTNLPHFKVMIKNYKKVYNSWIILHNVKLCTNKNLGMKVSFLRPRLRKSLQKVCDNLMSRSHKDMYHFLPLIFKVLVNNATYIGHAISDDLHYDLMMII